MPQIGAIQSLRAIAALMVVIQHLAHELGKLQGGAWLAGLILPAAPWMAGVDIFFVISGFIMVHASERLFGRPGGAATFLQRRLIRIAPTYWLMTAVVAAIGIALPGQVSGGAASAGEIAASLLFWPFMRADGSVQPVLSLGWTLNFEMLFYALFFVAMLVARTAAGVVAGACALLLCVLAAGQGATAVPPVFWGQPIILEFAFGMALGLWRRGGARLPDAARAALLVGGFAALVLAPRGIGQTGLAAVMFHGLPAVAIVAACALGRAERDRVSPRSLESLGDASYALYLSHPLALKAAALLFGWAAPPHLATAYVPLALAASVTLAFVVHALFERPVTAWLRARLPEPLQAGR